MVHSATICGSAGSEGGAGDSLKLTVYLNERDWMDQWLTANALLDLCAETEIEMSILFREVPYLELKKYLCAGRLLTLAEPLPMVLVAVDTRARIEALLPGVAQVQRLSLVTLEATHVARKPIDVVSEEFDGAMRLTIQIGRQQRLGSTPAWAAIEGLLRRRGLVGVAALPGIDGTLRGERQRPRCPARNRDLPLMVIAVGTHGEVAAALPELLAIPSRPLLSLERVHICGPNGEHLIEGPGACVYGGHHDASMWRRLTFFSSGCEGESGPPAIHSELVRRLRRTGIARVISIREAWAALGDRRSRGARFFRSHRTASVVTVLVDGSLNAVAAFDLLDGALEHRLVISETVRTLGVENR